MKKKILVLGLGFLGTQIFKTGNLLGFEMISTNLHSNQKNTLKLDVSNLTEVETVIKNTNPDYIINTASRNDVDFLELNEKLAYDINRFGAKNVSLVSNENNIRLIHISTDSIFDGITGNYDETSIPNPVNIYAKSKYLGEKEIVKIGGSYVIARTNFYGLDYQKRYLFNWILKNIKENHDIVGFTDVIFSPLNTNTLSLMLIELLTKKFSGFLHLSSDTPISKFDFVKQVIDLLGKSDINLIRGKISDQNFTAKRPKNTSLNNKKALKILKTEIQELPEWILANRLMIEEQLK